MREAGGPGHREEGWAATIIPPQLYPKALQGQSLSWAGDSRSAPCPSAAWPWAGDLTSLSHRILGCRASRSLLPIPPPPLHLHGACWAPRVTL